MPLVNPRFIIKPTVPTILPVPITLVRLQPETGPAGLSGGGEMVISPPHPTAINNIMVTLVNEVNK